MPATTTKPAVKKARTTKGSTRTAKPAVASKPATQKAAGKGQPAPSFGVKELAAHLDMGPKSLRARLRRMKGGAVVGRGGRYTWKGLSDPAVKEIIAAVGKA